MSQMRAVLSPEPLASRSVVGFHAQMNTSLSWPRKTVAFDDGISMLWSTSMVSCWDGVVATAGASSPFVSFGCNGSLFGGSVFSASVFVGGFWHFTSGITASIKLNPSDKRLIVPAKMENFISISLNGIRWTFFVWNLPSSPILISASVYCSPFCKMVNRAAGGTSAPLMLLCEMCDSIPKVYAEWWKPTQQHKYAQQCQTMAWIHRLERKNKRAKQTWFLQIAVNKKVHLVAGKTHFLMVARSIGMDFVRWNFCNRMRCRMVLLLAKITKKPTQTDSGMTFHQEISVDCDDRKIIFVRKLKKTP